MFQDQVDLSAADDDLDDFFVKKTKRKVFPKCASPSLLNKAPILELRLTEQQTLPSGRLLPF